MRTLALSPLLFVLACDSDGGGSTPAVPFEAAAADDKTIASLSSDEQQAFCQELAAYFSAQVSAADLKKLSCYLLAVAFTGGDAGACNQAATECLGDGSISASTEDFSCDTTRVADCNATVAEMETCFTDSINAVRLLASRASCSLGASDVQGMEERPASCQVVEAKCPNLFEEDGAAPQ